MVQEKKEQETEFWDEEELKKESQEKKREREERKRTPSKKINLEGEKVRDGLAQLILTVVELLRELMEKQAIRKIEGGTLTENQIEDLGNTFMALKKEIEKLKKYFKLEDEDLNIGLGPLTVREEEGESGKVSVVELLDRLIGKGVVVRGDVVISVAEVDLIALNLGLLLASIDKARELYGSPETKQLEEEIRKLKEENLRLKNKK